MRPADIVSFARRDWEILARSKAEYWRSLSETTGVESLIKMADELRRFACERCPDWPTDSDRKEDLDHHVRLAALLRRAADAWNH